MLKKVLFAIVVLLVFGWAIFHISENYQVIRQATVNLNYFFAAMGTTIGALVLNAAAVFFLFKASGSSVSSEKIILYNLLLQPLKYLPAGSAINAVTQSIAFSKIEGVKTVDAYIMPIVCLCIQAAVGLVLYSAYQIVYQGFSYWKLIVFLTSVSSIALIIDRRFIRTLARWALKKIQWRVFFLLGEWSEGPLQIINVIFALAFFSLFWIIAGTALYFIANSVGYLEISELPSFVAMASVSMVMGYAAFLVPAGIGAREGVLVLLLGSILSPPWPIIISIMSRLIWIIAELVSASISSVILKVSQHIRARSCL